MPKMKHDGRIEATLVIVDGQPEFSMHHKLHGPAQEIGFQLGTMILAMMRSAEDLAAQMDRADPVAFRQFFDGLKAGMDQNSSGGLKVSSSTAIREVGS